MMTPHIYLTVALAAGLLLSVTNAAPAGQESSELKTDLGKTNAALDENEGKINKAIEDLPETLKEWGVPESVLDGVDLKKVQAAVDKTIKDLPKLESEVDWAQIEKSAEEFKHEVVEGEEELLNCVIDSLKSDPYLPKTQLERIEKNAHEFVHSLPEVEKELESPAAWKKAAQMAEEWVKKHPKHVEILEQGAKEAEQAASEVDWHEVAKYDWWLADQATKYVMACMKGENYSVRVPLKKTA